MCILVVNEFEYLKRMQFYLIYYMNDKNSDITFGTKKVFYTMLKDSFEGFTFIKQRKGLLVMMLFFAVVNFFLNLSIVLLTPLVLSLGNPVALGTVQMIGGIGMLLGSFFVTVKKRENCLVKRIYFAIFFVALSLFIMGVRDSITLISIGRFLFLFFVPLSNSSAFAIWQLKGPAHMQGRLFAARQMLARSIMPIAYLIVGPLVDCILKPALKKDTYFNNIVGYLIGNGAGAAYRVIFVFSGMILLTLVLILLSYKPLRNLEVELPDFK